MNKKYSRIMMFILCSVLFILYIVPFFMILVNSVKSKLEVVKDPFFLPELFRWENYVEAFKTMNYQNGFINSLLITTASVAIIVVFSSMLAYYLVRNKGKLSNLIFLCLVAAMIIPFQSLMIPFVSIFGNLNLLNSRSMLVFYYLGFGVSMATFMYHGFIKNIPLELEESAMIDGATPIQIFFKVVFPMLKPITATIAILDVLWVWNDFLLPSLVLVKNDIKTLPLSTFYFFGQYTAQYNIAMAALVLVLIPVIIFFLIMQKQIIAGVTEGAIK